MGLRRRGRNRVTRCRLPTMPVTTAACGASVMMLLVVLFHCVLSPPLEEEEHSFLQRARIQGRSHLLLEKPTEFQRNAVAADAEEFHVPSGGVNPRIDLWSSNLSKQFYGCSTASKEFSRVGTVAEPNRYIMIATSGGLNQQRTGIIDAVVAARILNATLVIPKLDEKSFWKDASTFSEIFDVDWFISFLKYDVKIIKEIPKRGGKTVTAPYMMRVPRKCTPKCYQSRVLPALMKKHVVQLTKYDYRLSNNLEPDLQKLRCRVNYHALKFTDPIRQMGNMLVQRMRSRSTHFIALHLRFEPDMLAFSGCYYGGGEKERTELSAIRKRWKTLHVNDPDKERRHGKCPLTPEEVALMLRALGFGDEVHLYVASGEVYGGNVTLAPLKALFPNIHSKETLLSRDELAQFEPFSSRMAALDFIVCDESDVFVTNNNGNMARMLAGRRRYFGHKRTIRPNAKKLSSVFQNQSSLTWDAFQSKVRAFQKGFMGEPGEIKAGRGEFHENPVACICDKNRKSNKSVSEFPENDDGLDYRDLDYGENEPLGRGRSDRSSGLDGDNLLTRLDEAESDEFDFEDIEREEATNEDGARNVEVDMNDNLGYEELIDSPVHGSQANISPTQRTDGSVPIRSRKRRMSSADVLNESIAKSICSMGSMFGTASDNIEKLAGCFQFMADDATRKDGVAKEIEKIQGLSLLDRIKAGAVISGDTNKTNYFFSLADDAKLEYVNWVLGGCKM